MYKTQKSTPMVCLHCLQQLLALTGYANWRDAPRPGDSISKDIFSYLSGRLYDRSSSPLSNCNSTECIWNDLQEHLRRLGSIPEKKTPVWPDHGNGGSFEVRQEDDERTWSPSRNSLTTEAASWMSSRNSLPSGSDTDVGLTSTEIWSENQGLGSPPTPSYGERPELVRRHAYTTWTSEKSTQFQDQMPRDHQYGLMGTKDNQPSSLMTFMAGSPVPSYSNSWTAIQCKSPSREDTETGPRSGSSSRATSTHVSGTTGSDSDTCYPLSSEDSLEFYATP